MESKTRHAGTAARRLLALTVLSASGAFAQLDPAVPVEAEVELAPRYTVELIVFRYDESVPAGNEVFAPVAPPEDVVPEYSDRGLSSPFGDDEPVVYGDARSAPGSGAGPRLPDIDGRQGGSPDDADDAEDPGPLPADTAVSPGFDAPPARKQIELELLAGQEPRMNEIHQTLARLDAYHPIMRAAWTQSIPPREQAPAVHLQSLGRSPAGLDGNVTLYSGRFVHLVLDLVLDASGEPGASAATDSLVTGRDNREHDRFGRTERGGPVRYRISEDRIMRNGDIRYFDHPKFGAIARVTKAGEDGEDEPDEPDAEEIAGSD